MLKLLGISGNGYDFKFVKISAYIDPFDHSKQIRLLIKVMFKVKDRSFLNPLYIYLQSNRRIRIEEEIFDRSYKVFEKRYLKRIGADKEYLEENDVFKTNLVVKEISSIVGEKNKIRIEIIPDTKQMSKKLKNIEENTSIESGFMIDTVIQNEGIEKEPLWRSLSGWSRFAWKFHFKVWSITEDMEPVKAISQKTEQEITGEIFFTNPTDIVQVFLIIPKNLVESYGQVVTHPGGDTVHIITERDRNTFLITEKDKNTSSTPESSEERRKREERTKTWVEKDAMAISWGYGQTGSMSREVIVEHRRAHPRFWTFLTFATLFLLLGVETFPKIFPFSLSKNTFFWAICLVLFVFSYVYTNLYNFSFYELKKKTNLRYLVVFLRIPIICIIVVFTILSRFNLPEIDPESSIIISIIAFVFGSALMYLIENEKIKRGDIKIRDYEKASYMFIKIFIQIAAIFFVSFLAIKTLNLDIKSFPAFLACVYAIVVFLETSEGRAARLLQL